MKGSYFHGCQCTCWIHKLIQAIYEKDFCVNLKIQIENSICSDDCQVLSIKRLKYFFTYSDQNISCLLG